MIQIGRGTMIYVTGDMHGDISRFENSKIKKLKKGDSLIICGDFGFIWDGGPAEEKQLKKLGKKKYNILFILPPPILFLRLQHVSQIHIFLFYCLWYLVVLGFHIPNTILF